MLHRGQVTARNAHGVTVEVPELVPGFGFDGCQWIGHTRPTVGDMVLVADLSDGAADPDLVVVGVLRTGADPAGGQQP